MARSRLADSGREPKPGSDSTEGSLVAQGRVCPTSDGPAPGGPIALAGDGAKSHPRRHRSQVPVEGWPGLGRGAGLPVDRVGPQDICGTVRLEVDPGDQGVAIQERQHVVAVDPLADRNVDLEPVVEVEQSQSPVPLPDQGVEGRSRAGLASGGAPGSQWIAWARKTFAARSALRSTLATRVDLK